MTTVAAARAPTTNATVNACIEHATTLQGDLKRFHVLINAPGLDKGKWENLHDQYVKLQSRLKDITQKLKPDAVEKCQEMKMREGAATRKALDAAIEGLKNQNGNLLRRLNELSHDGKIQFPLPSKHPKGVFNNLFKAVETLKDHGVDKAGWIVTGGSTAFVLATLTPLGVYIGPYVAKLPQVAGAMAAGLGNFVSEALDTESVREAVTSPWMATAGKAAIPVALAYPAYLLLKDPLTKLANATVDAADKALAYAADHRIGTFCTGYLGSWAVMYLAGVDPAIAPVISPIFVRSAASLGLVGLAEAGSILVGDWKDSHPKAPIPKTPAALIPEKVSVGVGTDRASAAAAAVNDADDSEEDDDEEVPAAAPPALPAPLPPDFRRDAAPLLPAVVPHAAVLDPGMPVDDGRGLGPMDRGVLSLGAINTRDPGWIEIAEHYGLGDRHNRGFVPAAAAERPIPDGVPVPRLANDPPGEPVARLDQPPADAQPVRRLEKKPVDPADLVLQ